MGAMRRIEKSSPGLCASMSCKAFRLGVQIVQKVPLRNPFKIKKIILCNHAVFILLSEFLPIVNVVCKTVAATLPQ